MSLIGLKKRALMDPKIKTNLNDMDMMQEAQDNVYEPCQGKNNIQYLTYVPHQ